MVVAGVMKAFSGRYGLAITLTFGGVVVGFFGWLNIATEIRRQWRLRHYMQHENKKFRATATGWR
jgi:hypothetical protein